jgi:hypothetical protein
MAQPPQDLDPLVASALDGGDADSDTDLDALLSDPSDPVSTAYRAARLQQLSDELSRAKTMRASSYGTVTTFAEEKQLMETVASSRLALVHFFHPGFARCAVMDRHLEALAGPHFDTRFCRIDVQNAPFLCARLGIKVLPCLLGFVDGVVVEKVTGFEGLGEGFRTGELESRLARAKVLVREKGVAEVDDDEQEPGRPTEPEAKPDDEGDDDWD